MNSLASPVRKLSLEDFKRDRNHFVEELDRGLRDCGFIVLKDHGIDESHLDLAYQQIQNLFALPDKTKLKYDSGSGGERGYTAFGREHAAGRKVHDLKEFWHVGPELEVGSPYYEVYPNNKWPNELPEFKDCFSQLYRNLDNVAQTVLEAISEALGLPEDYFPELVKGGNSIHRLLHYPPVSPDIEVNEEEIAMRAAPHADVNLITLLLGATDSGLELLDKTGNWVPVKSEPGEIVVDTGDMMALITNNLLPSTVHRVVNDSQRGGSRYSMPFFLHPHSAAVLECRPECLGGSEALYQTTTAGEFLQKRLAEIGLKES